MAQMIAIPQVMKISQSPCPVFFHQYPMAKPTTMKTREKTRLLVSTAGIQGKTLEQNSKIASDRAADEELEVSCGMMSISQLYVIEGEACSRLFSVMVGQLVQVEAWTRRVDGVMRLELKGRLWKGRSSAERRSLAVH
jgi:hypothetical protein